VKTMYDRELSVSENRVKPANIRYNSSLIMGKQIINVLPEGSVIGLVSIRSWCLLTLLQFRDSQLRRSIVLRGQ
jgi:nucleoporin POM152